MIMIQQSIREKITILKQYILIGYEFEELYDSLCRCKAKYTDIQAVTLSDMPKCSKTPADIIGSQVAFQNWIDEMDINIRHKLADLEIVRSRIELAIEDLDDSNQRRILRLRYFDGYNWETIACKINYSWRQTHYLHSAALENIVLYNIWSCG